MPPPDPLPHELPRIGVVTIQGGGAVAVDLIGQLQGLVGPETGADGAPTGDAGIVPAAIAGTSAGAIIATLFWLGYNPEEIVDIVQQVFAPHRIDRFFAGRLHLPGLGFSGFARMTALWRAWNKPWQLTRLVFWPPAGRRVLLPVWWVWQMLTALAGAPLTLLLVVFKRGIFPGDGLVAEIDRRVRESRLVQPFRAQLPATGHVTFGQIEAHADPERLIPLFLIATDVNTANLRRICSFDDRDAAIPVAEAVRASAGFPVFFRPTHFSNEAASSCCLIDGGVVSNFPSWVFAQGYRRSLVASPKPYLHGIAYLPWVHYGLRLPQAEPAAGNLSSGRFLRGLTNLLTGRARGRLEDLLSATVLRRRDAQPALPIPGTGPTSVLDFSPLSIKSLVRAAFERGRLAGRQAVHATDFALPGDTAVAVILAELTAHVAQLLKPYLLPGGRVRANMFVPADDMLVLRYRQNMLPTDPDYAMRLRFDQGVTGLVFTSRQLAIANLHAGRLQNGAALPAGDPFLTQAGAPPLHQDCTWLISLPVLDMTEAWAAPPAGPLALDFTGPILGVLNLDAAIDYARIGTRLEEPAPAGDDFVVRAILDSMIAARMRLSRVFDDVFQENPLGQQSAETA